VRWVDLASRAMGILIGAESRRLPRALRYVYFPMLSGGNRLLAYGASPGGHDHFRSSYDVFVTPVGPTSLELLGRPLRLTSHPASDRQPDVHVETLDVARWARDAALARLSQLPAPAECDVAGPARAAGANRVQWNRRGTPALPAAVTF
jgi:hypothetical protein